jgi:hypothetical protein
MISFSGIAENNTQSNKNCFTNINLSDNFIAIETTFDSNLADWYQDLFQLETVKKITFPNGNTKMALMKKNNFIVEIFNKKLITSLETKNSNDKGYMKFGIFSNANLADLKTCLIQNNIKATRIYKDDNLKLDLLSVKDPEGNYFEIISSQ